jgi:hypothetical protein
MAISYDKLLQDTRRQQAFSALGQMGGSLMAASMGGMRPRDRALLMGQGLQNAQQPGVSPMEQLQLATMVQGYEAQQAEQKRLAAIQQMGEGLFGGNGMPAQDALRAGGGPTPQAADLMGRGGFMAGGENPAVQQHLKALFAIDPEAAVKEALELQTREAKPPQSRNRVEGDTTIFEEWNPASQAFEEVSQGPRYKPTTNINMNEAYKPLTAPAKLLADRNYLVGQQKLPEDHPSVQAIDRELAKIGVPSGESMRMQEMVTSGQRTMTDITQAVMPGGEIDMDVVAGMWINFPKSEHRKTRAQFEEVTSFILRLETGAQANEQEIKNTMARYMPSPLDDKPTNKDKMERLQRRFDNAQRIASGGEGSPEEAESMPEGVDQELWQLLTPEERALWQN